MTEEDLQRVAAATGGTVQTSVNNVINEVYAFQCCFYFAYLCCQLSSDAILYMNPFVGFESMTKFFYF